MSRYAIYSVVYWKVWMFVSCLALATSASAAGLRNEYPDFSRLESANLHVFSESDCNADYARSEFERRNSEPPEDLNGPFAPFDWVPTALPTRLELRGCEPERLEGLLRKNGVSPQAQAKALRDFFATCDSPLRWGAPLGTKAVFSLSQVQYRFCENPNMRKVLLRMPNGDRVRGILGLKNDSSPRPLIVAKCGVLCNAGDAAMRFVLMHLFDESPFNLLLLANSSGADYVRDNRYFVPGGFKEGQHLIYAAQLMRESAIGRRISSVHAVGISLGGHASLFASLLNPYQRGSNGEGPLRSVFAGCPVVDLEASMHDLFQYSVKGTLAQFLFKSSIDTVLGTNPELAPLFGWWHAPRWERPDRLADQAVLFLQAKGRGWSLPPFDTSEVRNRNDFWNLNQFAALAARSPAQIAQTPTLALGSADDEIVDANRNIKKLAKTNLATVVLPFGDHCAVNQVYGWRTASAIFRGYVLSRSHEFTRGERVDSVAIPDELVRSSSELHGVTRFTFSEKQDSLKIAQQYFIGTPKNDCGRDNPYFARLGCYRETEITVPFNRFGPMRPWWAHAPASTAEAESLSRWANVNVKLTDGDGRVVDGTTLTGRRLKWTAYGAEL